ncbi:hypothetical protein H7F16_14350 [Gemmobacter straminiformis]|uniref:Dolichyl-phosphate-mannose-protein mannosyltransferase n=2 Tax=Paragemmobacter straminiformis TaxID=2045119 RepID=A0A842ICJ6_9RHOB|nr:hypothetical protein [Gemmobacter straminiformis]
MRDLPSDPVRTLGWPKVLLGASASLAVLMSLYIAIAYAAQLPLEAHAFRQTQTAITALWFEKTGFRLAYETPVGGAPWAIPFEFPLYQAIVALLGKVFGLSIEVAGRGLSYAFLLACLPVAWRINRRLDLGPAAFLIFVTLLFTSPQYLFWGRSVMIETAALFFALVGIGFFLDYLLGDGRRRDLVAFALAMTLALLQKITTGLPVWVVLGLVAAIFRLRAWRKGAPPRVAELGFIAACFAVPLVVGVGWAQYTDHIKTLNPLGQALTSSALSGWNWGTVVQRLSPEFWIGLVGMRIIVGNLGSLFGLILLACAFVGPTAPRARAAMQAGFAMAVLPLFMFTNLHLVHDYYQTSCLIFLFAVMAVSASQMLARPRRMALALVLVLGAAGTNAVIFLTKQLPLVQMAFGPDDRDVAVARVLARELPGDGTFVAFGNGWSSTFSYLSQRRSFTVPDWFAEFDRSVSTPEAFVGEGTLGAVLTCAPKPTIRQLVAAPPRDGWKIGETAGCDIAVPARSAPDLVTEGDCTGAIEKAVVEDRGGVRTLILSGWTAPVEGAAPEALFVSLEAQGQTPLILDTLRVPDLAANRKLGVNDGVDLGFSRLLPGGIDAGEYRLRLVQLVDGAYRACRFTHRLRVD